jgi:hypothetical protein
VSHDGGTLLSFPCDLPIKVLGRNHAAFRGAAETIVRAHYGDAFTLTEHASRNGNYVSLTITVRAQSRAEVDAVYHALVASDDILMVL